MPDIPPPPENEETSYPEINDALPPPPGVEVHGNDVLKRKKTFSWRNFGGDGFLVSVAFHVILLLLGLFYVVRKYTEPKKPDTEVFATGAGGGANGDKAKQFEHKMQRKVSTPLKSPSRIVSKSANSAVSLPSTPTTSTAVFASGLSAGGMSKGAGGGSGGGQGAGVGIGVGGGKNFVGSFLGMKIGGNARVAVYMDDSGSMKSYLPRVEAEAKRVFPEADVYRANGIYLKVEDGVVAWGSKRPANNKKSFSFSAAGLGSSRTANDPANFSEGGKKLLRAHAEDFFNGSVGGWFDIMLTEKYDALILFSDFQDGVEQRAGSNAIYLDRPGSPAKDERKAGDKSWENRWYRTLAKAPAGGAPKVYCFSIDARPQDVWAKCCEISGGSIHMVQWLKTGGKPPADQADSDVAGEIARGAKNKKALPVR